MIIYVNSHLVGLDLRLRILREHLHEDARLHQILLINVLIILPDGVAMLKALVARVIGCTVCVAVVLLLREQLPAEPMVQGPIGILIGIHHRLRRANARRLLVQLRHVLGVAPGVEGGHAAPARLQRYVAIIINYFDIVFGLIAIAVFELQGKISEIAHRFLVFE